MTRNGPDDVDVIFALLLFLVLCVTTAGCAKHAEVKSDTTAQSVAEMTREQGPETITTTVEEWEDAIVAALPPTGTVVASQRNEATPSLGRTTMPPHPILVKRTVTVDQRGPVTTKAIAVAANEVKSDAEKDSHPEMPRVRCGFGGTLWALVALLLVGGTAYGLWKLKLL